MVKRRLAVVVSPRLKHRQGLCTVVPLSTTQPQQVQAYQCLLVLKKELPPPFDGFEKWAKCDMIATVGFHRLSLPYEKNPFGPRKHIQVRIPDDDQRRIMEAVKAALGL